MKLKDFACLNEMKIKMRKKNDK